MGRPSNPQRPSSVTKNVVKSTKDAPARIEKRPYDSKSGSQNSRYVKKTSKSIERVIDSYVPKYSNSGSSDAEKISSSGSSIACSNSSASSVQPSESASNNSYPRKSYVNSRTSPDEIDDYLDLIYKDVCSQNLSSAMKDPDVMNDYRSRHRYHSGVTCARQFNLSHPYVLSMLRKMYSQFDCVSFCSMGLLEAGMIVYYLAPYTLGLDQASQGEGTATIGRHNFSTRVHLKGRFGIVVDKYTQALTVAEVFTFGGKGLQSKPRRVHAEYVGLQCASDKEFYNPSPYPPLEVAESACDMSKDMSVHLVTDKIGLSHQILFAGRVTSSSLRNLRDLIKKTEEAARR
ncbi:hypothetical protein P280DRAFT_520121 [Massarina eburnea CBS 473.64]|uniref:Uncharacterized protein n=1 Tax=Massarina eburnea CBS 473.64 TaxID=1395130 RepID=A0A6A6RW72_9PLEO|nr:hypothetical protein P280DRAFT_520121 [Massarina eburnea CBS 473.64]